MKKVINITIGGVVFNIEEDAYETLSDYLSAIKRHFSKDKDGDEIVEDIETSISEKFMKRKNKDGAVSIEDVETVIEQMGSIKDFKKISEEEEEDIEEERETVTDEEKKYRKLYRDPDDVIIAGVCSGLAAYFGIETVLMRLLFFVTVFFGGFGILLYVILWIIMPEAKTTTQKLEMRGERITLHEIEKSVKNEVSKLKKKDLSAVKKGFGKVEVFLSKFFRVLGAVVWAILRLLRVVLGVALIGISIADFFAVSFAITWQLSGATHPDFPFTARDFLEVTDTTYWFFMAALYAVLIIPNLIMFFIGLNVLKKRWVVGAPVFIVLVIFLFSAGGLVSSVAVQNMNKIEQEFQEIEQMKEMKQEQFNVTM